MILFITLWVDDCRLWATAALTSGPRSVLAVDETEAILGL